MTATTAVTTTKMHIKVLNKDHPILIFTLFNIIEAIPEWMNTSHITPIHSHPTDSQLEND